MGEGLLEKKHNPRFLREVRRWEERPAEFCSFNVRLPPCVQGCVGPPAGINGCISISKEHAADIPREQRSKKLKSGASAFV